MKSENLPAKFSCHLVFFKAAGCFSLHMGMCQPPVKATIFAPSGGGLRRVLSLADLKTITLPIQISHEILALPKKQET